MLAGSSITMAPTTLIPMCRGARAQKSKGFKLKAALFTSFSITIKLLKTRVLSSQGRACTVPPMAKHLPTEGLSDPWKTAIVHEYTGTSCPSTTALFTDTRCKPKMSSICPRNTSVPRKMRYVDDSSFLVLGRWVGREVCGGRGDGSAAVAVVVVLFYFCVFLR